METDLKLSENLRSSARQYRLQHMALEDERTLPASHSAHYSCSVKHVYLPFQFSAIIQRILGMLLPQAINPLAHPGNSKEPNDLISTRLSSGSSID